MLYCEWNHVRFGIIEIGGGILQQNIAFHAHPANCYELHYITGGEGCLTIGQDREYRLREGCFFLTGPGLLHAQSFCPENPVEDVYIYLQKKEAEKPSALAQAFLRRDFYFDRQTDFEPAKEILREFREKKMGYAGMIAGSLMIQLTQTARKMLPPELAEAEEEEEYTLDDRRFLLIDNAFLYEKELTLTALADRLGVCPRQAERLLQKYYGKSFREKKRESGQ